MAQPYLLFIPDRPVITVHLDDDELHCAEFGRIHNHDTEEQDAHPTGKQQRTAYASHPTVRARLATPNQIGSQKLSFLEDWCWVLLRCTTFNELRAGVFPAPNVAAKVYRGRSGNVHGRSTAPAMPRHA